MLLDPDVRPSCWQLAATIWQNPEVTEVPLARASAAYVEWVERVTSK